jgi:hypothetical protein
MTTKAKATRGTKLQRGDGATPETFTTIAEVRSSKGPSTKVGTIDATTYDSTAKEFVADIPDAGEVTFELNEVASDVQQQGLQADRDAGTLRNFRLVKNDHPIAPSTTTFASLTIGYDPEAPAGALYKASVTLKVSGLPVRTYAPS